MRRSAVVPLGLIGAGAVLVALAALQGGAQLAVVVIFPVLYGTSIEFVGGVLLLVAGLFTLPLAFDAADAPDADEPAVAASHAAGGLLLVGPVPIFFGSWRGAPTRTRVILAILGAAVLAVALAVVLFGRR